MAFGESRAGSQVIKTGRISSSLVLPVALLAVSGDGLVKAGRRKRTNGAHERCHAIELLRANVWAVGKAKLASLFLAPRRSCELN